MATNSYPNSAHETSSAATVVIPSQHVGHLIDVDLVIQQATAPSANQPIFAPQPTIDQFISTAFHTLSQGAVPLIWAFRDEPGDGGWTRGKSALFEEEYQFPPNGNNYLNCSSFTSVPRGLVAATEQNFLSFHFLLLDDVGTKVDRQDVAHLVPTWEIETSSGNSQFGFVLTVPISDPDVVKRMQGAAISAGMCDPEASGITLWARLPCGINGKHQHTDNVSGEQFTCRLIQWNPDLRYTTEEMMTALRADAMAMPPTGSPSVEINAASGARGELANAVSGAINEPAEATSNALAKYSLLDRMSELDKNVVDRVPIFGEIVLLGQATAIYAKPNTGKTLITLQMIIDGVRARRFDPAKLYYVNMDDDSRGLLDKGQIAQDYGFNMLADGYYGFEAKRFDTAMLEMISNNTVDGAIVVLDTLKKFVNTMDKNKTRRFAGIVRGFVLKGGTVVALAHTNKNLDANGGVVYSGTSDIVDDFDCAYTLSDLPQQDKNEKIVVFKNFKRRGNVPQTAAYGYALQRDIAYTELLSSVRVIAPEQLDSIQQTAETATDADVISAIAACIREGVTQKMLLRDAAAKRGKVSERQTMRVIEKYTGEDPLKHHWTYTVAARGAKVFTLLDRLAAPVPSC